MNDSKCERLFFIDTAERGTFKFASFGLHVFEPRVTILRKTKDKILEVWRIGAQKIKDCMTMLYRSLLEN